MHSPIGDARQRPSRWPQQIRLLDNLHFANPCLFGLPSSWRRAFTLPTFSAAASLSARVLLARRSWPRRGTVNASTITADIAWTIMAIAEYGNNGHGHGYTIGTAVMARHNDDGDNDGGHNDSRHGDSGNGHRKARQAHHPRRRPKVPGR